MCVLQFDIKYENTIIFGTNKSSPPEQGSKVLLSLHNGMHCYFYEYKDMLLYVYAIIICTVLFFFISTEMMSKFPSPRCSIPKAHITILITNAEDPKVL